ncbi:hypothetical protein ACFO1B_36885 [Dactylosporangium siamense]|uniref:Lipoprotein n=1 Tax=Dactylosporangium siamense TaxID=685454 RepID=A0A919UBB9_9ACTN|nr:hypothetical protein [Dactylosporangium siamense]GIG49344.1 hypothetical protein Dsi01nite_073850 [Dactylosporangium siamense]
MRRRTAAAALTTVVLALAGCGGSPGKTATTSSSAAQAASGAGSTQSGAPSVPATQNATTSSSAAAAPPANYGNPSGRATVPAEARAVDTSKPTRVVGNGTPGSCTSEAVVSAVAAGGIITFSCGPEPVTITMKATAKVKNVQGAKIVLDGGGKVTLSGEGRRRILYMNTCDQKQGWTTSHCQDQDHPSLTVQNLTFADGNSTGETAEGGGGGAIFVRGGRFKVVNSRFVRNRCDQNGPDLGGAAIRVLSQFHNQPVYVVGSTFGGASGQGGVCANGGALSSIGVSWVVLNSVLSYNSAVGKGANPARAGTPGGGSGGAIYCDGNLFTVRLAGTLVEQNKANEGGGAVFFVSNDRTGTMSIESSTLRKNPSAGFETQGFPGIFFLGARPPSVSSSSLTR